MYNGTKESDRLRLKDMPFYKEYRAYIFQHKKEKISYESWLQKNYHDTWNMLMSNGKI